VRDGNKALEAAPEQIDTAALRHTLLQLVAMLDVLGVNPLDPSWGEQHSPAGSSSILDALVQERLRARAQARADRDFATADAIRDQLGAVGVAIEDTPSGARWSLTHPTEAH